MNRRSVGDESAHVTLAVMDELPTGSADEAKLVELVASRDADALDEIYRRHGAACYRLARQVTMSATLAEDCVQEAFLALWRRPEAYRASQGALGTWLLGLTHHKAVDAVRRETAHQRRQVAEAARKAVEEPRSAEDPAAAAWGRLRAERLRSVLGELPAGQREAIALSYFGGYTQREIAGLTGVPLGTVKTRMMAGMGRLREVLRPLVSDQEEGR